MKRYALLLDYLYAATFQQEFVNGFISALEGTEDELYIFLGGPYGIDPYDPFVSSRNGVYDMISGEAFDGVIVANSISTYVSTDDFGRFLERYSGIPLVCQGTAPKGYPRVAVDNRDGMARLVRHFAVEHGYRRIAFITGPLTNHEAVERYDAYRNGLDAAGLPFDPVLVCEGDFNIGAGMTAVRILMDERRSTFDALIASNDFMALGAKLELERRGIVIPTDVALAGFDDTMDARCIIPSLTTVRQAFEAIARRAFAVLADLSDGQAPPEEKLVPAELIIRQSCGCYLANTGGPDAVYAKDAVREDDARFLVRRGELIDRLSGMFTDAGVTAPREEIAAFLDAVGGKVLRGADISMYGIVQPLLSYCLLNNCGIGILQDAVSLARSFFVSLLNTLPDVERAENVFHKLRLLFNEVQEVQKNQNLLFNLKQTDQLSEISQALFSTVESSELANVIYRTFPLFGIDHFLFADFPDQDGGMERARTIALIRGGKASRELEGAVFPSRRLFPEAFPQSGPRVYFVLPVVYQEKKLGFAVFGKIEGQKPLYTSPGGGLSGGFYYEKIKGLQPVYLSLTRELAKSYYINRLIAMRRAAEESLKALTADLEFRNRELEDFAHIASHDLKEPLRKISFFSERLLGALAGRIDDEAGDQLERIQKAAFRMNELLDGLLTYSRISSKSRPLEPTDLRRVVMEVIQDLEVRIGETKGRVEVGDLPVIPADALQMRELFQNLIGNALKYHRSDVPPLVTVSAERSGDWFVITVADNGIGFDPKYKDRIFGIFQRLVSRGEYEGAGVGLAICKKIVERHNGVISAHGEPGKGAIFKIRFRGDGTVSSTS